MALNPTLASWRGQRVWLIGASSGIGLACAEALHQAGAEVCVSARQAAALDARSLGLQTAPITGLASVGVAPLSSSDAQQRIAALSPDNLAAFTVPK